MSQHNLCEMFACVGVGGGILTPFQPHTADASASIVDLTVYFPSRGEACPPDFVPLDATVTGLKADLNRSMWGKPVRLAYRRATGRGPRGSVYLPADGTSASRPSSEAASPSVPTALDPITDIAFCPADEVPAGWEAVRVSPTGLPADVSGSSFPSPSRGRELLIAYRRASATMGAGADPDSDTLPGFVTDLCVVFTDRETAPANFVKVCDRFWL